MHRRTERWPIAILVVAAAVLALGAGGFEEARSCRLDACLYSSFQLFVLEFPSGIDDPPLALNVARFLAPLVLGWAVVLATLAGARERLTLFRLRLIARGHVVVLGLTDVGAAAAIEKRQEGERVVVADPDPDPALLRACRRRDIDVISQRATHSSMLQAARADRAQTLLIATGDDSANLLALAAIKELRSSPKTTFVEIHDVRLWAALHSLPLDRIGDSPHTFFCPPDRAARLVLDDWLFEGDGAAPSVLVYGRGPVAERIVVQAARRADLPADRSILLAGPAAAGLRDSLVSAVPWLDQRVALAEPGRPANVALVAGLTDAEALAAPITLSQTLLQGGRAWVAVSDDAVIDAATRMHLDAAHVRLVPTTSSAVATRLLDPSAVEVLAQAKHEDYVMRELRRGSSRAGNPSLLGWRDLPESLKQSNRRFAESVRLKLAALGAELQPLGDDPPPGDLAIDESTLEELAREEHERWMHDLEVDGWLATDGQKDAERKLHPLLVDWDQLPPQEQEKDRDTIRGLPAMLARVGYRMSVPGQG